MNEYENPNELPQEDAHYEVISTRGKPNQADPYTYYTGTPNTPSEYRYVPHPKKKKKKQPWVLTIVLVLCCCLLSGAMGVGEQIQSALEQQQEQQQTQQGYPGNFPWGRP